MAVLKSLGTSLSVSDGTSPLESSFDNILNLQTWNGFTGSLAIADVTTLADTYRKKLGTINDAGTTTGTFLFDPDDATHDALWDAKQDGALLKFRITTTDTTPTKYTFDGYVTQFTFGAPRVDGAIEGSFTIDITGQVTKA